MKSPEYIEGVKAQEDFEEGMKALFKVSKAAVVKAEQKAKKRRASRTSTQHKPQVSRQGLEGFRLPRPCRFVARRLIFARQVSVGETMTKNATHGFRESFRVSDLAAKCILPIIESESLLINIAEQMERFYADIRLPLYGI